MENIENEKKERFHSLTLVERLGQHGGRWKLQCDCGTVIFRERNVILAGRLKSCGCSLGRKDSIEAIRAARTKHGMEKSSEYRIWIDMRRRCHDPRRPDYKNYGARGITVSLEWRDSFEAFYRDMGPRPDGHTLDRMNNAGPYDKHNCVWATRKHQERNKRTNRIVQVDGRRMTVAEAAELYGVPRKAAIQRLNAGWSMEDTFKRPMRVTSRTPKL